MAILYPDNEKTRVIFTSPAEQHFYNAAKQQLSNSWKIYYSVILSDFEKEGGLKDNEIDFVLYHPSFGIIAMELKGGRIHFNAENGKYYSINRHNKQFEIKDPFKQVLTWKSRFLRYLKHQNVKVPVSHAVCMPSVNEDEFPVSTEIKKELIFGRQKLENLSRSLINLVKISQPEQYLNFEDIGRTLDKLLVGKTYTTKLYLRDYLDNNEMRVKDLELIHESLITPIINSKRLGIEGEAGTGKTILAIIIAKRLFAKNHKVLFLSSNNLLNLYLQKQLGEATTVKTYSGLASTFGINLLNPDKDFNGTKEDWIQYEAPDRFKKQIENSSIRYSAIICDEAQDVQPFWWEALEALIDSNNEDSRLYLFFDRSQGVFGSGGGDKKFIPEEALPISGPYFPLVNNYRTTREIAIFSRKFAAGKTILQSHSGRLGYIPKIITYKDAMDCKNKLRDLFEELITKELLSPNELTILSARNPSAKESVLYNTSKIGPYLLQRLLSKKQSWKEARGEQNSIGLSTITSFKGLETPIAILINISEYKLPIENPIMSSLVYVACTRAKHMLYVFLQEDDSKLKTFKDALKTINPKGSLIIQGGPGNFEFSGTVGYYNPDRLGIINVNDPAFHKKNIMFLPYDVEQNKLTGKITTGITISFQTRIEGNIMIAHNLKLK